MYWNTIKSIKCLWILLKDHTTYRLLKCNWQAKMEVWKAKVKYIDIHFVCAIPYCVLDYTVFTHSAF